MGDFFFAIFVVIWLIGELFRVSGYFRLVGR